MNISMLFKYSKYIYQYEFLNLYVICFLDNFYKTTGTSSKENFSLEKNLDKRAVKLSLNDLKEKHLGVLQYAYALKIICDAPDLAKTIAGLILSSSSLDIQGECFSLLGLQPQEVGDEIVEDRIKERMVSVIKMIMNDGKPPKTKEVGPFLFEDDYAQEVEFQEND